MDVDPAIQRHTPVSLAAQACATCRKQKRRCDKVLPSCGLCVRIGRQCDYDQDTRAPAPSPQDFQALRREVAELKSLLSSTVRDPSPLDGTSGKTSNGQNVNSDAVSTNGSFNRSPQVYPWSNHSSFPSLYFLDSDVFEYARFQVQPLFVRVPSDALRYLGSSFELRSNVERYFAGVHTWFPIVSKIRLYQQLASPLHEPGADIALLFLAMKLVADHLGPNASPHTPLYQQLKALYTHVESHNGFSIQTIQALLLIGVYELGHAIYPAAYLTVGHAARLGYAMGVHERDVPQMIVRATTWTEQEERRRVWWGAMILDRLIHSGNRGKPLATSDPSLEMYLPSDDAHWDKGEMLGSAPLALSASQTVRATPFARTCQAAHLLGKAIRHLDDSSCPQDYKFDEALRLNRTIRPFVAVLTDDLEAANSEMWLSLSSALGLGYSALSDLYDRYSCTERAIKSGPEAQLVMQQEAINGLREYTEAIARLAGRLRTIVEHEGAERLSPLILDALYNATANYAWYVRESSDPSCTERLSFLRETLALFNNRWRLAGEYDRHIDALSSMIASK